MTTVTNNIQPLNTFPISSLDINEFKQKLKDLKDSPTETSASYDDIVEIKGNPGVDTSDLAIIPNLGPFKNNVSPLPQEAISQSDVGSTSIQSSSGPTPTQIA